MKIRIKTQCCVQAGSECHCLEDERRATDEPCGDCCDYEATVEQARALLAIAKQTCGSNGAYLRRVALTLIGVGELTGEGLPEVRWSVHDGRFFEKDVDEEDEK